MRAKQIFEFTRNSDPMQTMGIGYKATIYKFFDDFNVDRSRYNIESKNIKFNYGLNLSYYINLVELPDNLTIDNNLHIRNCTNLVELPNNLTVGINLDIRGCTKLVKLSDNLQVGRYIIVLKNQTKLLDFIRTSKFKDKLLIE